MVAIPTTIRIYVDADACPVKDEVYRVAGRHQLPVFVVTNSFLRVPQDPLIERIAVAAGPGAADDWIAERADASAIVITADIPLAGRCVKAGAVVIAPDGRTFTEDSIGMALAMRDLMTDLRSAGEATSGPRPFSPHDRSAFLSALDRAVRQLRRRKESSASRGAYSRCMARRIFGSAAPRLPAHAAGTSKDGTQAAAAPPKTKK